MSKVYVLITQDCPFQCMTGLLLLMHYHCPIRHSVYKWYLMALLMVNNLFVLYISNKPLVRTNFGLPGCEKCIWLGYILPQHILLCLFSSLIHNFWKKAGDCLHQHPFTTTADLMPHCKMSKSLIMGHGFSF